MHRSEWADWTRLSLNRNSRFLHNYTCKSGFWDQPELNFLNFEFFKCENCDRIKWLRRPSKSWNSVLCLSNRPFRALEGNRLFSLGSQYLFQHHVALSPNVWMVLIVSVNKNLQSLKFELNYSLSVNNLRHDWYLGKKPSFWLK